MPDLGPTHCSYGTVYYYSCWAQRGFVKLETRLDQIELLGIFLILEIISLFRVKSSHLYKDGTVSPLG